ncbi:hypothetical protein C8J56DRAFT_1046081 [Mycena floridula]|nr:hypothetical protein C8J56DRAFT_1046081 [Mycena floridula]
MALTNTEATSALLSPAKASAASLYGLRRVPGNDYIRREIFLWASEGSSKKASALSLVSHAVRADLRFLVVSNIVLKTSEDWKDFLTSSTFFGSLRQAAFVKYLSLGVSDGPKKFKKILNPRIEAMHGLLTYDDEAWKTARSTGDEKRILEILRSCTGLEVLCLLFRPFKALLDFIHHPLNLQELRQFHGVVDYVNRHYDTLQFVYDHYHLPFEDSSLDTLDHHTTFLPLVSHLHLLFEFNQVSQDLVYFLDFGYMANLTHLYLQFEDRGVRFSQDPEWSNFFHNILEDGEEEIDDAVSVLLHAVNSCSQSLVVAAIDTSFADFAEEVVEGSFNSKLVLVGWGQGRISKRELDLAEDVDAFWKVLQDFLDTRNLGKSI